MKLERKCSLWKAGALQSSKTPDEGWIWNLISFCIDTGIQLFNNIFSSEQVEEMDFNILLFLYFEAPVSQCKSIKNKELIHLIPNEDLEQQMHISQTLPQNAED